MVLASCQDAVDLQRGQRFRASLRRRRRRGAPGYPIPAAADRAVPPAPLLQHVLAAAGSWLTPLPPLPLPPCALLPIPPLSSALAPLPVGIAGNRAPPISYSPDYAHQLQLASLGVLNLRPLSCGELPALLPVLLPAAWASAEAAPWTPARATTRARHGCSVYTFRVLKFCTTYLGAESSALQLLKRPLPLSCNRMPS